MKLYKRLGIGLLLAVLLFGFSGRSAEAADFVIEATYELAAGETLEDTMFVNADTITNDGDINGTCLQQEMLSRLMGRLMATSLLAVKR